MSSKIPVALTIAGSDSGGGAGIQADIKSMQANGVFAASVITAVTAQNTTAVTDAVELPIGIIKSQIDAVFDDLPIAAVKTGMLSSAPIIETVSERLRERWEGPLVVDPVMISKSGFALLQDDAVDTLVDSLLRLATIVTPNAHEAARLARIEIRSEADAREAARRIRRMGPGAVLVKGGHLSAEDEAVDVLYDGERYEAFRAPRIETTNTHGTGCTYASAIAANLARGFTLNESVGRAKRYVTWAIEHGLPIGSGHGPTDHFYYLRTLNAFPIAAER